ncbi:glycosyl hydrolase [Planctomycetales bacterium]|nr:glycosyl hydrolase [Planctomycetales bacterium]
MLRVSFTLITLILFAAAVSAAEFTPLFNGKDTTGWKSIGGKNKFYVEDGQLILETGDESLQSYIVTEKTFENFIVNVEFKFDAPFGSGLQFRSVPHDGKDVAWGYQSEISPEKYNGGFFDEGVKHNWLQDITELEKKSGAAFKKNGWNTLEVKAVGPSLKASLNGTLVADVIDIQYSKGFIGFQIHESKTPGKLRIKSVTVKELPATPWIPLYADGKFGDIRPEVNWVQTEEPNKDYGSLVPKPVAKFQIQDDGSLRGTTAPGEPRDGILTSNDSYKDFAVKVSFKMEHGNSGLYFRAVENTKPHWLSGFQCEIAEDASVNAALWEVDGRGWVQSTAANKAVSAKATKKSDWNDIATVAIGDHIVTFLNGQKVMDIIDPKPAHGFSGKVGLQLHGGGNQGCLWRDFYVMPLNEAAVNSIR